LSQVIGTAGVPVYLPANGISGQPYGTLFGRPVIPVEYADTLGTEGDITLADYSQYVLADKGGVQTASSMHVAFLTDEMVFRFIYRVDGEPIWHAALTPFKGSNTLSPFVTLATR
jgi:HK97 family phage major capsid protein